MSESISEYDSNSVTAVALLRLNNVTAELADPNCRYIPT